MDGKTKLLGGIFVVVAAFAAYSYFGSQSDLSSRVASAKIQAIEKRPDITMTIVKNGAAPVGHAPVASAPATVVSATPIPQAGQPVGQQASCPSVGNSYLSLRTPENLFRFNLRAGLSPNSPALAKFSGANLKTRVVRDVKTELTDSVYVLNEKLVDVVQSLKTDSQTFNCLEWYLTNASDSENCEHLASAQHLSITNDAHGLCIVGTLADVHVYRTPGTPAQPISTATATVQQR